MLRPFLLRRLKRNVEDQLPDKVEKVLKCGFSAWQKRMYEQMREKGVIRVEASKDGWVSHPANTDPINRSLLF